MLPLFSDYRQHLLVYMLYSVRLMKVN